MIWNPLALCYISHISGGEHPPNFTILGKMLCVVWSMPARAWEGWDAKG